METLLAVTAVIELGAGIGLVTLPSTVAGLLVGSTLDTPAAVTVARVAGAALLALGVACLLAREDSESRAARGLAVAMLLYNIAVVAILAYAAFGIGLHAMGIWSAMILHTAMAIWCIACLRGDRVSVVIAGSQSNSGGTQQ